MATRPVSRSHHHGRRFGAERMRELERGSSSGSGGAASGSLTQPGLYGKLPPPGTPTHGGTITYGQLNGNTPNYIFPIVPSGQRQHDQLRVAAVMWLPLYNNFAYGSAPGVNYAAQHRQQAGVQRRRQDGHDPAQAQGYKWNNGKPVDAQDVLFDIALIKAAVRRERGQLGLVHAGVLPPEPREHQRDRAVHGGHASQAGLQPRLLPQQRARAQRLPAAEPGWNVTSAHGPHLNWKDPANAKKIYDYLGKAGGQVGTFASNPLWKIADGPYVLQSFSPVTASWTLKANPDYGGTPKPYLSSIQGVTYTGITPMLNAMRTGTLDIGSVDFSQLADVLEPQVPGLQRVRATRLRLGRRDLELQEHGQPLRQDHRPALLPPGDGDAGQPAGDHRRDLPRRRRAGLRPVPRSRRRPYVPANAVNPPYPYNPAKAVATLKAHGWHVVPNGQTTCANPGTGANQCGAGIPKGTPISFPWATETAAAGPYVSLTDEAVTSEAKQAAGINIELSQKTFNYIASNYNDADPSVAKYTNDWGGGELQRLHRQPVSDTERDLQHRRLVQQRRLQRPEDGPADP